MNYSVVIPMAKYHLPLLKRNVKYIQAYLHPQKIIVLCAKSILEEVKGLDGVEAVDGNTIYEGMTREAVEDYIHRRIGKEKKVRAGWYFQQFLKMAYAFSCKEETYLVWDVDTFPLAEIPFYDLNRFYFYSGGEHNTAYYKSIRRILGNELTPYEKGTFVTNYMLICSNYMEELIKHIIKKSGNPVFWKGIFDLMEPSWIEEGDFSEFETYGEFTMGRYPGMYEMKPQIERIPFANLMFGIDPTDAQLAWAAQSYRLIGFESRDYSQIYGCLQRLFCGRISFRKFVAIKSWSDAKQSQARHRINKVKQVITREE